MQKLSIINFLITFSLREKTLSLENTKKILHFPHLFVSLQSQ